MRRVGKVCLPKRALSRRCKKVASDVRRPLAFPLVFHGRGECGKEVFTMTATAYKDFDFCETDFNEMHPINRLGLKKRADGVVSYFAVTKCNLGFRECAHLVEAASETGSIIRLVAGRKTGNADSILSLIKMGIKEGTPVAISILRGDTKRAFEECMKAMEGRI